MILKSLIRTALGFRNVICTKRKEIGQIDKFSFKKMLKISLMGGVLVLGTLDSLVSIGYILNKHLH